MRISGIAKTMMMSRINGGNAVKMGETNVYAILGSTKKGPTEFAKMAAVKVDVTDSPVPMKKVVNIPSENYFQGYMTYEKLGENLAKTFEDFSVERFFEIMEYLQFDKAKPLEKMSDVSVQKIKIAVTLSRNSRVYMLENPFKGMNSDARGQLLKVIFSWAIAANTIAILCNSADEAAQLVEYAVEHGGDMPVISTVMAKSMNESFA